MEDSKKVTRAEKTQQNKELIISKSIELFRDHGYEETTMADISRSTGLTNGSIYHIFGNKSQILQAVYDHFFGHADAIVTNQENISDPVTCIKRFILDFEQIWTDAGWYLPMNVYQLLEIESDKETIIHPIDDYPSAHRDVLRNYIQVAQAHGTIRDDCDAAFLANGIFLFGRGFLYQWSISHGKYDLVSYSAPYWDVFLESILTK